MPMVGDAGSLVLSMFYLFSSSGCIYVCMYICVLLVRRVSEREPRWPVASGASLTLGESVVSVCVCQSYSKYIGRAKGKTGIFVDVHRKGREEFTGHIERGN